MADQEPDNAAEQQARAEENKQEAEQLIKRYRQEILAPSNMLGILTAYLLFITALLAFGAIAFYSGHLITLKIVFLICIPLLLIPLGGVIWYLRTLFPKKSKGKVTPGKQSPLERFMQSSAGMFVARLARSPSFKLFNCALCIYGIVEAIRLFPLHPRFSLAVIVYDTILFLTLVNSMITQQIADHMESQADLMLKIFEFAAYTYGIAESSRKFIENTEPSHQETHQTTTAALKALDNTVHVIAGRTPPHQLEPPSQEVTDGKDDKVANDR